MSETTKPGHTTTKKVEPPFSGPLAALEAWLYSVVYEKVPLTLPVAFREWVVKYGPWITLVVGILLLPSLLTIFAVGSYVTSVYSAYVGVSAGPAYYIAMLVLLVEVVLMFAAISPLLKRRRFGWQLLFYSSTLSLVYAVFDAFGYGFNIFTLIGGLIGAAVGYYVIFQIRSYYKA
jgi:hypothetical protein